MGLMELMELMALMEQQGQPGQQEQVRGQMETEQLGQPAVYRSEMKMSIVTQPQKVQYDIREQILKDVMALHGYLLAPRD